MKIAEIRAGALSYCCMSVAFFHHCKFDGPGDCRSESHPPAASGHVVEHEDNEMMRPYSVIE
jgi:hypothetical protein